MRARERKAEREAVGVKLLYSRKTKIAPNGKE